MKHHSHPTWFIYKHKKTGQLVRLNPQQHKMLAHGVKRREYCFYKTNMIKEAAMLKFIEKEIFCCCTKYGAGKLKKLKQNSITHAQYFRLHKPYILNVTRGFKGKGIKPIYSNSELGRLITEEAEKAYNKVKTT